LISDFRRDVDEICTLLGCYAACRFVSLATFHGRHLQGGREIQIRKPLIGFIFGGILDRLKMKRWVVLKRRKIFHTKFCVTTQKSADLEAKFAS
jgi:hypothetical protein